ncbi:MAG: prolyl-tRNA synthetase [Candidatus Zambryskibacteria bacterium RIFCSPHIGHO2_01_FULL_43_25]|uniref:Proline--tRNA ligase n=1 Tax=Candidatus Zambryskibacteria bacterium RIFCSPLOWO2_01_FULL_45_21 TaxID=1802761 RepID=A0A1G2U512_9BACT|nr:MAG: prolyl-tRNA synthetase [Candidatus Zambryskibacteria bacterium RIFCSPHIGHO2_01_FULL_43_25]OHB01013.1 MAG: prolyl-tRNA synthetase [Candidatus Zambryskibacteria bacterium RIFCSPHIGHO2_12_FULL_44_12b]OHB03942.1 MAG: prolyl-tRNA synthetase [Candidatus Zambryskibacteria bacterium RIFCSPLOWO2_01_FULL_45_21]
MLQSKLFSKTRRESPKDDVSKNASILIRAGFINKEMAGVYSFLPLGLRTLNKIIQIIREEMDALGGQELLMSALQEKETWEASDRWDDDVVDVWFKTKLKNNTEIGLATTHEEPLTKLLTEHIHSYRDLPTLVYQFQTKFRNELRAKGGLLRTREFIMKDLYSFCRDKEEHGKVYESLKKAYVKIFERVGLGDITYLTFASGGSFSPYSHEFQTVTLAGEDNIYVDEGKRIAVNAEVLKDEVLSDLGLKKEDLIPKKAIEVGNIFTLGTRFSEALGLVYADEAGVKKPVFMGSYGIGPARLMGTIIEALGSDNEMIWPENVAPFRVHLINLGNDKNAKEQTLKIYKTLTDKGVEVLCDDRDGATAGEKFGDADLIGIPLRVVVSEKSISSGGVEFVDRRDGKVSIISAKEAVEKLK